MEANELRIGNYAKHYENGIVLTVGRTVAFKTPTNTIRVDVDDLEPIKLTEEWLLKFGFEKIYSTKVRSVFDFSEDLRFGYLDFFGFSNTSSGVTFIGKKFEHIKYVHQLQNLYFALTGKELTLNK